MTEPTVQQVAAHIVMLLANGEPLTLSGPEASMRRTYEDAKTAILDQRTGSPVIDFGDGIVRIEAVMAIQFVPPHPHNAEGLHPPNDAVQEGTG